ncbi:TetR/AcrR family transcriptional regulator [Natranaerofaba carboxydovora]|uniref:TetR/AcrR family transcriptional regulator n=1 Tax=Natranaerofaba carboxydovora TaxID=2742683 RepID=UPI001F13FF70|nr:TetR/AcrR family transcriptional regulator [Natranaerofaba carboxydovora]UMZ73040.1 HTH-type transcriptional repressor KstR2 [Natranaerofaba carboxydovora]
MVPKGFEPEEKKRIKEELKESARQQFCDKGIKGTTISELTKQVGIAGGSFYSLYDCKEELFFEIIEDEEDKIKKELISSEVLEGKITQEKLKKFLFKAYEIVETNPIIKRLFFHDEYQLLLRKLPQEKVNEHIRDDMTAFLPLINTWREEGALRDEPTEVIGGLLRALFLISLHKKEIGEDIYDDVIRLLIELISEGLIVTRGDEGDKG